MAGSYPDVPSRRYAWDADGSVLLTAAQRDGSLTGPPATAYTELSLANAEFINDETATTDYGVDVANNDNSVYLIHLYPEKRELDGLYIQGYYTTPNEGSGLRYSTDSLNGYSGTWSDPSVTMFIATGKTAYPYAADHYRTNITSLAISNVRALLVVIKGNDGSGFRMVHPYGTITPGETPDRLTFLDTENSDAIFSKVLDYGDVPRGQTQTRTFKVKNNSSTKQANTVQVTAEDLFGGAGSWYTFSDDDVSYQATFAVGNLGTGATKLLYIKQIVPDAQVPGPYAARIKANQASWT